MDDLDDNQPVEQPKWRMGLLIIAILVMVLVVGVATFTWFANNTKITSFRTMWINFMLHGLGAKMNQVDLSRMSPGIWNLEPIPSEFTSVPKNNAPQMIVPLMIIPPKNKLLPPVNWLKLTTSPDTILYLHGGNFSCQSYYPEMSTIANYLNVRIIMVEYPGFGDRKPQCDTTEKEMLDTYPRELHYLLNIKLGLNWKQTIVWANCFGGPMYLRCLWYMVKELELKNVMPAAIYYSKPWVSGRRTINTFMRAKFIAMCTPANLFSLEAYNSQEKIDEWVAEVFEIVTCPVLMIACEKDDVTKPKYSQRLLDMFENASQRRFKLLKNVKHGINMVQVIGYELDTDIPYTPPKRIK